MKRIPVAYLTVLFAALVGTTPARADSDARDLLERMSMAARTLNYSGTFVYQHQGQLDAMRIIHSGESGGERERLMSLTGPKREILRDNQVVTCILGDSESVYVNRSRPRSPFPASFPKSLAGLEQLYSFRLGSEDRVAGLMCRMIEIRPRDTYRYGRRLCVHGDSYMMLRSELTDFQSDTIEQMMFTSVNFPEHISEKELLPDLSGADYTWKLEPEVAQAEPGSDENDTRWEVIQVPEGFVLTDHNWHQLSAHDPGVEHWVYSDGLASVSVYIEKAPREHGSYQGVTHRGALNAYGTMIEGHYVTVVGEVPMKTVELIGNSVQIR
ncbi:MucB/RseB-like sigma(E) regulatory protein [Thiogranum longum]|uniref:MucB/RseB-like sigma(E) regulatory protein n=1 Tax=Thiogranum longum TaxID=1537524 RepID=A0A4R1H723_9GAMM|nr:MucB/RseB C-terminal domain-containing protein [Thiogranum longum]TCK17574.1 MucB/RseB-like sigma(E) regulatory protein [Thiogranum longum]